MPGELIFLVTPDDDARERLSTALHGQGYQVLVADSEARAVEELRRLRFALPDAMVASLPEGDSSPLLQLLRRNPLSAETPIVLLAGDGQDDRLRALRLGIPDVVPPPHDAEEVVLTTRLALDRARERADSSRRLKGSIQMLPVPDLLQTMEAGRRSGVVVFRNEARAITLWVSEGRVVDAAEEGGPRGETAVFALLAWSAGTFEASFGPVSVPERIVESTGSLLLEGLRRLDEAKRNEAPPFAALEDPPPPPPREVRTAHRALTLLNVASADAIDAVAPEMLVEALERARAEELGQYPELRHFRVTESALVALDGAEDALADASPERVVAACAVWIRRLYARLDRALPGRFSTDRIASLLEAVRDDLDALGFSAALASTRPPAASEKATEVA